MTAMAPGNRRTRTVAGVTVAVLAALSGVFVSLTVAAADGASLFSSTLSALVVLSFAAVGAVVASARPANRIGWLLLTGSVLWALGNAGVDAAYRGIVVAPGSLPGTATWAVGGSAVRGLAWWVLVLGVPVLFPDGRISDARWRWLVRGLGAVLLCSTVGAVFAADADLPALHWRNPIGAPPSISPAVDALSLASTALGVAVSVGAVLQLRARWRRGGALERQQLLLFAVAAAVPVVVAPLVLAGLAGGWLFSAAVLPLPVAIGVAVLARGLYDLRTAVNRTLVWISLSALVVGIYALVIAGVGSLLDVGGAAWLQWLAAGVVALLFAPLRDAAQRAVNRVTFGRWDEPYAVLSNLGQQVEAARDVDRLIANVVDELENGLGLREAAIVDARGEVLAGSGVPVADAEVHPLTAYGESVGCLRFRAPSTPLRARDRRLLDDLAGHLGSLLHARLLTVELQRARERLVLAREEERRRLRRDLHDGLGPALASHLLQLEVIAGQVGAVSSARPAIELLREDVRTTILDVRRVVEGLRPPALDELGLEGALVQAARRLTAGTATTAVVLADGLPPLPAAVEVAAFRIISEALTNVVRHAAATHCSVELSTIDTTLRIVVRDDGSGPGTTHGSSRPGHGLDTMRERAEELRGRLRVDHRHGTIVTAELPVPARYPITPSLIPAPRS
jgi:signal transduction histidine kinase